jgi:DNA-binding response OmpR family regulator
MLTALGTTDDKVEGFDAGADDYLVKPFDLRELHVRIRAQAKRQHGAAAQGLLRIADLELDPRSHEVRRAGQAVHLTPKEFSLLAYLMQHAGRVVPRTEIAREVWGIDFDTGTNFIDVYINYLRRKMDRDHAVKLIHTKPGVGFVLREAPPA